MSLEHLHYISDVLWTLLRIQVAFFIECIVFVGVIVSIMGKRGRK